MHPFVRCIRINTHVNLLFISLHSFRVFFGSASRGFSSKVIVVVSPLSLNSSHHHSRNKYAYFLSPPPFVRPLLCPINLSPFLFIMQSIWLFRLHFDNFEFSSRGNKMKTNIRARTTINVENQEGHGNRNTNPPSLLRLYICEIHVILRRS